MNNSIIKLISEKIDLEFDSVKAVSNLFSKDATTPFIARYRKEATGGLDEVQIGDIKKELDRFDEIIKRKKTIIKVLKETEQYSQGLQEKIDRLWVLSDLEDFYLPYKPKKTTKASVARDKGLEPLAKIIMAQRELNIESKTEQFLFTFSNQEALEGARHIIAEWISEKPRARNFVRHEYAKGAIITSKVIKKKEDQAIKFTDYFNFSDRLQKCPAHRLLAMYRGEKEGFLRLNIEPINEAAMEQFTNLFVNGVYDVSDHVKLAAEDAYKRLLKPSIETEFKKEYKDKADQESIEIFEQNLKQLLLAPPLGEVSVLAIDPGFRTGCKAVILNEKGNLQAKTTFFFHTTNKDHKEEVLKLITKHKIEAIAIGDGTAGRETESKINEIIEGKDIEIYMISEAGASIYSGSEIAREEFPDEDITVRGAISIGRRLLDPLSELVKIDPKSIGVGQYQHDVNQKMLKTALDQVVESAVNKVGINLNTSSKYLLKYVSGISNKTAENIVKYRRKKGAFKTRNELMKVDGLGAKTFELSAGFLRIKNKKNPLDDSAVHPESYSIVKKIVSDLSMDLNSLIGNEINISKIEIQKYVDDKTGLFTLKDIIKELAKPGVDPRGKPQSFAFDKNVRKMEDLKVGMKLPGIVTNITKFGAFVDVGVKQDGLVHISQLADKYVSNPMDVVSLRDQVFVKVIELDLQRKRINLSIKEV